MKSRGNLVLALVACVALAGSLVSGAFLWRQWRTCAAQRKLIVRNGWQSLDRFSARDQASALDKRNRIAEVRGRRLRDTLSALQRQTGSMRRGDSRNLQLELLKLASHCGLHVEEVSLVNKEVRSKVRPTLNARGGKPNRCDAVRLQGRARFEQTQQFLASVGRLESALIPTAFTLTRGDAARARSSRKQDPENGARYVWADVPRMTVARKIDPGDDRLMVDVTIALYPGSQERRPATRGPR